MYLPVINYSAQQPQGDPLAAGILPALQQGMQLGFLPRQLGADLQKQQLANQLSQVDLKYAPQAKQADIDKTNALAQYLRTQNQYYGADMQSQIAQRNAGTNQTNLASKYYPQDIASQIGLRNAQTASTNIGTQYKPLEVAGQLAKNQTAGMQALATYMKSLDEPTKAAIAQQNPAALGYIANQGIANTINPLANILGIDPNQAQNLVGAGMAQNVQIPTQSDQNVPMRDSQSGNSSVIPPGALNQNQNLGQMLLNRMPPPLPLSKNQQAMGNDMLSSLGANPQYMPNQEQTQDIQKGAELARTKAVVPPQVWDQYSAAKQVSEMFNDQNIRKTIIGASKYANSITGKGAEWINAFTKKNPESYQDYLDFKNNASTYILNRVRGMDAMGKTDSQREELNRMVSSLNNVKSNPQQFLIQMDRLGKTSDSVAKAVEKSANPFGYQSLKLPEYNPILDANNNIKEHPANGNTATPRNDEILATAQKYGISPEEVRRKLGI